MSHDILSKAVDHARRDDAAEENMTSRCIACGDKQYLISVQDDGRQAIERCDACAYFGDDDPRTLSDTDAAKLARDDGIGSLEDGQ
jgi:hypothetical protein